MMDKINELLNEATKIDIRSNNSLYIKINGWTYYIDDSTNEQIVDKWRIIRRKGK